MVPKCKMEAAVDAGYGVVAGLSLELALLPPLPTEGAAQRRGLAQAPQVGRDKAGLWLLPPRAPVTRGKFAKELAQECLFWTRRGEVRCKPG